MSIRQHAIRYCYQYARKANKLKQHGSALEQQLIAALCKKHPAVQASSSAQLIQWNQNYAEAMRELYQAFPDDLDVICLSCEALVNLTPWKLWDLQKAEPAENACTEEAIAILNVSV